MAMYTPTATNTYNMGSSGATHTVIVAPSQGVLRYVPYAVNASVGDTIMFMWGANEHTVTKSSVLTPCNETKDAPFASGEQNKSFVFTQVVNDTNTTWFYCGTPTHCEKGMFGLINPPNAAGGDGAVSSMMASASANSSSMAAMASYASMMTANNSVAANWGSEFDLSNVPDWAQSLAMENILYTRTFLAANPDVISADGSINLGNAGSNPLMIPMDITQVSNNAASSSDSASSSAASSTASATSSASSSTASSTQSTTGAAKSGAGQLASPRAAVGLVSLAAMLFML
jgi:plastocyanin